MRHTLQNDVPGDGQVRIRRRVSLQAGETVTVVAP